MTQLHTYTQITSTSLMDHGFGRRQRLLTFVVGVGVAGLERAGRGSKLCIRVNRPPVFLRERGKGEGVNGDQDKGIKQVDISGGVVMLSSASIATGGPVVKLMLTHRLPDDGGAEELSKMIHVSPPPPSVGGLDLNSSNRGCVRLGGEVDPPLGVASVYVPAGKIPIAPLGPEFFASVPEQVFSWWMRSRRCRGT